MPCPVRPRTRVRFPPPPPLAQPSRLAGRSIETLPVGRLFSFSSSARERIYGSLKVAQVVVAKPRVTRELTPSEKLTYLRQNGTSVRGLADGAAYARSERASASLRYWCTKAIAMLPSPTAAATRFTGLNRTSPQAKVPGTLVSSRYGSRASSQRPAARTSEPVST